MIKIKKMFSKICDFDIYADSKDSCLDYIFEKEKIHIVSGNPEVLYTALNNEKLLNNFKSKESFIIPDGVGVKIVASLTRQAIKEKIAGIELMHSIIEKCEKEGKSIYLLGASDDVIGKCVTNLKIKYPTLTIAGWHSGYFDEKQKKSILHTIKETKPYALFVALGCPKQEEFIISNMNFLPTSIFMGVGGSFDVVSGVKKRAPKLMVSLGLEWLYRVIKEPFRIKRLFIIPKFIFTAIFKYKTRNN